VGESTLLAPMADRLGSDQFYYVNFEDDRFLGCEADDANDLYQILVEVFRERKIFIIDEVQNITGWEHFVRRFMDMGFKFYITGSNASLLSKELGRRLTGRYVLIELLPFSFKEFTELNSKPFLVAISKRKLPSTIQRLYNSMRQMIEIMNAQLSKQFKIAW